MKIAVFFVYLKKLLKIQIKSKTQFITSYYGNREQQLIIKH